MINSLSFYQLEFTSPKFLNVNCVQRMYKNRPFNVQHAATLSHIEWELFLRIILSFHFPLQEKH